MLTIHIISGDWRSKLVEGLYTQCFGRKRMALGNFHIYMSMLSK